MISKGEEDPDDVDHDQDHAEADQPDALRLLLLLAQQLTSTTTTARKGTTTAKTTTSGPHTG